MAEPVCCLSPLSPPSRGLAQLDLLFRPTSGCIGGARLKGFTGPRCTCKVQISFTSDWQDLHLHHCPRSAKPASILRALGSILQQVKALPLLTSRQTGAACKLGEDGETLETTEDAAAMPTNLFWKGKLSVEHAYLSMTLSHLRTQTLGQAGLDARRGGTENTACGFLRPLHRW